MHYDHISGGGFYRDERGECSSHALHRRSLSKRPDFRQLNILLTVAELRSFTGASRLLGVTQPAISQAIARLEEIYGGDLFERRRGAKLALTPIARAILPSARALLKAIDQQLLEATKAALSQRGTLTLASSLPLFGPLRDGIMTFLARSPDVSLKIVEDSPALLLSQIHARHVDLVVLPMTTTLPEASLAAETLWSERLLVALPCKSPLVQHPVLTWADLEAASLLVAASDEIVVSNLLQSFAADTPITFEVHAVTRDTLLEMVGLGMGSAIVGASSATSRPNIAYRALDCQEAAINVGGVWPSKDSNPLRHSLVDCIRRNSNSIRCAPITL